MLVSAESFLVPSLFQHSASCGRAAVGKLPQNHTEMNKLFSQAHNSTVPTVFTNLTWAKCRHQRSKTCLVLWASSEKSDIIEHHCSCRAHLLKHGLWAATGLSSGYVKFCKNTGEIISQLQTKKLDVSPPPLKRAHKPFCIYQMNLRSCIMKAWSSNALKKKKN